MSMDPRGNGQPSPEEMRELQEQMEKEREDRNTAQQLASQAAMEQGPARDGYWSVLGSPDISRGSGDDIEEFSASELSRMFALGNITRSDWNSMAWRTETEFWTMQNEFKSSDTKMGDDDLRIMYGEDRQELTNERARRLRTTSQVKKWMASLSIDARGLKSGTEIHAVAKTENDQEEEEEKGRIGRLKSKLV